MALLFADSFDHYATGDILSKWSSVGTIGGISASYGRNTNGLFISNNSNDLTRNLSPGDNTIVWGMAVKFPGGFSFGADTPTVMIVQTAGGTSQITLRNNSSGYLELYRGSTLVDTSTNPLSSNTWAYVELKADIDTTTGSYEVRVNGVSEMSGSGVNTANAGTDGWGRIVLDWASFGNGFYVDDLYICDGTGSNNTFLGDIKVECLIASSGNGSNTGLTPSTGVDHGALVDESTPNTTDYNGSATAGVKDTYNFPSLATASGQVLGVQTLLYASKSDAGARTACPVIRSGGTDYDQTTFSPSTSWSYERQIEETDPDTATAWTISGVNAVEFGMKVVS